METIETKINQIAEILDQLIEDPSVPKNVRRGFYDVKDVLLKPGDPPDLRITNAANILESLSNSHNMPLHARTTTWNLISQLETLQQ